MDILVINPGSTSTKIAIFKDERCVLKKTIPHDVETLKTFKEITDQYEFRLATIREVLASEKVILKFDAVVGRGGLAKPLEGGVYEVTERMREDVRQSKLKHACNLGCLLSHALASEIEGCKCYIADPAVVDEMPPMAHVSGLPELPRKSIWHALNQRATARKYAMERGLFYEELNLIVCHLGGGISVAAHAKGKAIDVNNALGGEGSFSPERAGTLPAAELVRLCFSGKHTQEELLKKISGLGGLTAHLGTNNAQEAMQRVKEGDEKAKLIIDAMIYRTAKAIAAEGAALKGKVDAILLTGGMAYSDYIVEGLKERLNYLAPIAVYPGENEMESLARNALMALRGELQPKNYDAQ